MKKLLFALAIALVAVSCSKVPAGHKGVRVFLLGGEKGVDHEVLGVGRYYIGFNQELYIFPTFNQNDTWKIENGDGIKFQTKEGMECVAPIGIEFHVEEEKISELFQKYRKGIDEIKDLNLRNHIRDAFNSIASQYPVESVYGQGKTELLTKVSDLVKKQLEPNGIMIDKISYAGSIVLPSQVTDALNRKIEATQRAEQRENELREAKAEAEKKIATAQGDAKSKIAMAEGEAEANRILNASISPNLLKWRGLELEEKSIGKWNGQLPSTMLPDSSLPMVGSLK